MSLRCLVSPFDFKFINDDPSGVTIEPLSGGLMNYCFRVSSSDQKHSVVLKHTEETSKVISVITGISISSFYSDMNSVLHIFPEQ